MDSQATPAAELTNELESLRPRFDGIQRDLSATEASFEKLTGRITGLIEDLLNVDSEIGRLRDQVGDLRAELTDARAKLEATEARFVDADVRSGK
jgi:predicted  nucleic acid-binding Zn-ribbon protein